MRPSDPLQGSPRSLLILTVLETYNGQAYTRPAESPGNLQYASGRIDHALGHYKSCCTVTLKWHAPMGVTGITGYRVLHNLCSESLNRYATENATTGANIRVFVDGRDADVCSKSGIAVSYFAAAITAGGDSFPAKVHVNQTPQPFQLPSTPALRDSLYEDDYKVRLECDDLGNLGISGYEISYRPSGSAAWRTIVVNAGNVLEYDYETIPRLRSSVKRTAEKISVIQSTPKTQAHMVGESEC